MSSKITIFISHDGREEVYANSLKILLEKIFPVLNVYVSGTDIKSGIWIEDLKKNLKSAKLIITLLSKTSLENKWVLLESGAGFQDDRTIPLLIGNLTGKDLEPPLSFLQAHPFNDQGLRRLISELADRFSFSQPLTEKELKRLLWEAGRSIAKPKLEHLRQYSPKVDEYPIIYDHSDAYCLVYEFPIEEKYRLAIDVVFNFDTTEIQFFGRDDAAGDYLWNKLCKTKTFLPKSLEDYPKRGDRLIFARFSSSDPLDDVKASLTTLVQRIQA